MRFTIKRPYVFRWRISKFHASVTFPGDRLQNRRCTRTNTRTPALWRSNYDRAVTRKRRRFSYLHTISQVTAPGCVAGISFRVSTQARRGETFRVNFNERSPAIRGKICSLFPFQEPGDSSGFPECGWSSRRRRCGGSFSVWSAISTLVSNVDCVYGWIKEHPQSFLFEFFAEGWNALNIRGRRVVLLFNCLRTRLPRPSCNN